MAYTKANAVISPKKEWKLIEVVLDEGEGRPAYCIGQWEGNYVIGFRWNGTDSKPLGNPQSRGLSTWVILDAKLYDAVYALVFAHDRKKADKMRVLMGDLLSEAA